MTYDESRSSVLPWRSLFTLQNKSSRAVQHVWRVSVHHHHWVAVQCKPQCNSFGFCSGEKDTTKEQFSILCDIFLIGTGSWCTTQKKTHTCHHKVFPEEQHVWTFTLLYNSLCVYMFWVCRGGSGTFTPSGPGSPGGPSGPLGPWKKKHRVKIKKGYHHTYQLMNYINTCKNKKCIRSF